MGCESCNDRSKLPAGSENGQSRAVTKRLNTGLDQVGPSGVPDLDTIRCPAVKFAKSLAPARLPDLR